MKQQTFKRKERKERKVVREDSQRSRLYSLRSSAVLRVLCIKLTFGRRCWCFHNSVFFMNFDAGSS
jgi:hypothetical protein